MILGKKLEVYGGLYKNLNTKLVYEIKDRVLIFNSLKRYLGKVRGKKVLNIGFGLVTFFIFLRYGQF